MSGLRGAEFSKVVEFESVFLFFSPCDFFIHSYFFLAQDLKFLSVFAKATFGDRRRNVQVLDE